MDFENLLQQFVNLAGTFSPNLILFLFVICVIGEFHITIPYVLETIWLLSGFHAESGVISAFQLFTLWLVAQAGRQTGATLLFYLSLWGMMPLKRLYKKYFNVDPDKAMANNNFWAFRLWRKMNYLSPLSVATGRLFWLRIPLTVTLGIKKRFKALALGVLLSSIVWDGMYILVGVIGGHVVLKPVQMVAYSLVGLTALYVITLALRQVKARRKPATSK